MKLVRSALIAASLSATLVAVTASCGGSSAPGPTSPQVAAPPIAAARWVPSDAAYVMAGQTLSGAQEGMRAIADQLGMFAGMNAASVGQILAVVLGVDAISTDAVAAIGVDPRASFSLFSEGLAPTVVVKINDPDALARFIENMRGRGMRSTSVVAGGTEVFSAPLGQGFAISWAIADGWLWVHLVPPFAMGEGTGWFEHSRAGQAMAGAVATGFAWAQQAAGKQAKLTTWLDAKKLLGMFGDKLPQAKACLDAIAPLGGVGVGVSVDSQIRARITVDVGNRGQAIEDATLPLPEMFPQLVDQSAIAAQWNVDLVKVQSALAPCLAFAGVPVDQLAATGVRAARVAVKTVNLGDQTGEGVVSLELTKKDFFAHYLDKIPGRRFLEKDRSFGPLAGHALSIPTVASVDYVLNDQHALIGMGDGLLASVVGNGGSVPAPLARLDLRLDRLDEATWRAMLKEIDAPAEVVMALLSWREIHFVLTREGSAVALTVTGARR